MAGRGSGACLGTVDCHRAYRFARPSPPAAPRRRAAGRGEPHPYERETCGGLSLGPPAQLNDPALRTPVLHVDLDRGTLALDPGSTKNAEGRIVYMPADVTAAVAAQLARVDGLQRRLQRIVPWVFPHLRGAREPNPGRRRVPVLGERRGDFRKAWATAAGTPACLGCSATTCGGARFATWSTRASPSASR